MKKKNLYRCAAGVLAVSMTAALAGCSSTAESESTAESAAATEETASTAETAVDESAYDYLASFSYSDGFDENGYLKGVTASDYVTLADDYADITIDAALGEVSDIDVAQYICDNYASVLTDEQVTDRAAASGDIVNIDYVGSVDGVEFDGGSTQGQGANLVLGSQTYIDDFEDQIVGHMPGETFDVTVTFPENYGSADLAGKEAVFNTTLNYIFPEPTDEWVQTNLAETTGLEDAASLNDFIKKQITFNNQYNDVYSAVYDKATFAEELPESAKEYFRNVLLYRVYSYAQNYGTNMTTIVSSGMFGTSYASIEEYITAAESSVNAMVEQVLLLQAVAEKQGLKCDTDTLNAQFTTQFGLKDYSSITTLYGENYIKWQLLDSLAMQNLMDNVKYA